MREGLTWPNCRANLRESILPEFADYDRYFCRRGVAGRDVLGIGLQQLATRRLDRSGLFDTVVVTSRRDLCFNRDESGRTRACRSPALDEPRGKIEKPASRSLSGLTFHHFLYLQDQTSPDNDAGVPVIEPMMRSRYAGAVLFLRNLPPRQSCKEFRSWCWKTAKPGSDDMPVAS